MRSAGIEPLVERPQAFFPRLSDKTVSMPTASPRSYP